MFVDRELLQTNGKHPECNWHSQKVTSATKDYRGKTDAISSTQKI